MRTMRWTTRIWALVMAGVVALPGQLVAQDGGVQAGAADARSAEEVLAAVDRLFDAMREKDEATLRAAFHPDARLHTAGAPGTGTPIEDFIASVLANDAVLDEVTFDERVLVDGPLAVAWTPYTFHVGDRFSHCGTNAFTFVRTERGWEILQVVDTRTQAGCDPDRRG